MVNNDKYVVNLCKTCIKRNILFYTKKQSPMPHHLDTLLSDSNNNIVIQNNENVNSENSRESL